MTAPESITPRRGSLFLARGSWSAGGLVQVPHGEGLAILTELEAADHRGKQAAAQVVPSRAPTL